MLLSHFFKCQRIFHGCHAGHSLCNFGRLVDMTGVSNGSRKGHRAAFCNDVDSGSGDTALREGAKHFLLSARFACLVALALPSAAGAVDVAADSLVWGHALIDANAISAPLANLECVDDLHFSLQLSKATINRAGIAGLARHGRKARWAGACYRFSPV